MNKHFISIILFLFCISNLYACSSNLDISQIITEVEAGEEIDYEKVITCTEDAAIKLKSSEVNQSKVGQYKVLYEISYKGKIFEKEFAINIIDTTPPELQQKMEEIEYGAEVDLLSDKYISVNDITDQNPTVKIVNGEIDTSTPGEYNIIYETEDTYKNTGTFEFTYKVNERKYTVQELIDYANLKVEKLAAEGVNVKFDLDEFDTGAFIGCADSQISDADNGKYFIAYPSISIYKDDPIAIKFSYTVFPVCKDIFSYADRLYFKSDSSQFETSSLYCGSWDYAFPNFYTPVFASLSNVDDVNSGNIQDFIDVFASDSVRMRLSGDFILDASLPTDVVILTRELSHLYLELCEMYS